MSHLQASSIKPISPAVERRVVPAAAGRQIVLRAPVLGNVTVQVPEAHEGEGVAAPAGGAPATSAAVPTASPPARRPSVARSRTGAEREGRETRTAITYPEKHPSGNGAAPSGRTEFPEYSLLVRFAAYTGLRAGELGALRVGRLDLLRRRVEVTESVSEVKGHLVFGPTKTYQNRSVPIPRFLCEEIALALTGKGPDDFVFSAPEGGPLRHGNFYARHFKPALRHGDSRKSQVPRSKAYFCRLPYRGGSTPVGHHGADGPLLDHGDFEHLRSPSAGLRGACDRGAGRPRERGEGGRGSVG